MTVIIILAFILRTLLLAPFAAIPATFFIRPDVIAARKGGGE